MSDLILELSKVPRVRRAVQALGVSLPEPLRRPARPWLERDLADRAVAVVALAGSRVADGLTPALEARGATYQMASQRPRAGLLVDATGASSVDDLRGLPERVPALLGALAPGGRVVVLARPELAGATGEASLVASAAEGFVRSLAKELGRRGVTVNLVRVAPGAEDRAAPVVAFLLSEASAFITGQPLTVTARAAGEPPEADSRSLAGRVAIVTGAARGIGEATVRALAAAGARVVCVDRPDDAAATRRLASEVQGEAVLADVTASDAPEALAAAVRSSGVDVVVHNAGVTRDRTFARMELPRWDQVMAVNALAPLRLQAALDPLLRDGGRVVVLSSIAGLAGNVGQTAYAASKAGVAAWARSESARLASRGVTVNAVAPGFIETRMTAAVPAVIRQAARRLSALGQGGLPEDVAAAIAFLASPGAVGVTGATVRVCGGALVGA